MVASGLTIDGLATDPISGEGYFNKYVTETGSDFNFPDANTSYNIPIGVSHSFKIQSQITTYTSGTSVSNGCLLKYYSLDNSYARPYSTISWCKYSYLSRAEAAHLTSHLQALSTLPLLFR